MTPVAASLAILSAIITPSLLILACASLIGATAQRLTRIIEKSHRIAGEFQEWVESATKHRRFLERRRLLLVQVERNTRRCRILQQAMTVLYTALSALIATSATAGFVAVTQSLTRLPIVFGLIAVTLLLIASLILILESRLAMASVNDEMDLVLQLNTAEDPR